MLLPKLSVKNWSGPLFFKLQPINYVGESYPREQYLPYLNFRNTVLGFFITVMQNDML